MMPLSVTSDALEKISMRVLARFCQKSSQLGWYIFAFKQGTGGSTDFLAKLSLPYDAFDPKSPMPLRDTALSLIGATTCAPAAMSPTNRVLWRPSETSPTPLAVGRLSSLASTRLPN